MKRYVPILAILVIVLFASDGWAPPPSGGGGSGIPIRKVQDLLDVTKPLSPANGEGLLYGTDANKFFATDIQTQVEADAQVSSDAAAFYDSSESAVFSGVKVKAGVLDVDVTSNFAVTVVFNGGVEVVSALAEVHVDSSGHAYVTIDRGVTSRRGILQYKTAGAASTFSLGLADDRTAGFDGSEFFIATGTTEATAKLIMSSTGLVGLIDTSPDAQLDIQSAAAGNIGLIVQGATSQSANLANMQSSADTVLFAVDKDGWIPTIGGVDGSFIQPPSYGQMSIDDNTDSLVATTNTVWYPVIEYDETPLVAGAGYVTATTTTGILTIGANGGGIYEIGCRLSGQHSASVGVGVHFAAFKNGSTKLVDVSSVNDIPVQNKHIQNLSFGMATLVAGDTVECKVKAESTDTITVDHAHIMISRISQ